jgi:geranyl-CoA carboxylase alpha subunit
MQWRGRTWAVEDLGRAAAASQASTTSDGNLRATMNGRVVAVQVAVGDTVQQGQALVTLEAMKMEHVHLAPCAGVVAVLNVGVGDQVASRRVLVQVVPAA